MNVATLLDLYSHVENEIVLHFMIMAERLLVKWTEGQCFEHQVKEARNCREIVLAK